MPTRTAVPGTLITNDIYTAAHVTSQPAGWLGYVEKLDLNQTVINETNVTGLSITVTVGTSRRIRIKACVTCRLDDPAPARANLRIKESTTALQSALGTQGTVSTVSVLTLMPEVILTPTAGSHTYTVSGQRDQGAGNLIMTSTANNPAYLLVEDIGPA